ncbi:MAG TPA: hypothetical protein VK540_26655 [Polyangiaceae bacterium]|nr:hypothetical protein [Polyangiaceae bacterium]
MRIRARFVAALATCGALGCAAESLDDGLGAAGAQPDDKGTDTAQQALAAPGPPIPLDYDEIRLPEDPNDPNPSLPGDQWVCALGGMSGNMQAGDVDVDVMNGAWRVNGRAQPGEARPNVRANCVPLNRFSGVVPPGQGDTTRWLSSPMRNEMAEASQCDEFSIAAYAWLGDASTFLTRIMGGMYGGAEWVHIGQSDDPNRQTAFAPHTCQGTLSMWVRSLFVGNPGIDRQAKFRGPFGVGSASAVGEYEVDRNMVTMARTDQAFCYFTYIQGAFAGYGELAEIAPIVTTSGEEVWALRTRSLQGVLRARARCYMFDQT